MKPRRTLEARDPAFAERVRDSFGRQPIMHLLGAELTGLDPGRVEIALPFRHELTQQHGYFHAGVVGTIADSAGGYAAFSMMPAGSSVLTVEYKLNLVAPADGERLRAIGQVIRSGRTLTVCELEAYVTKDGEELLCAIGTLTAICLIERERGLRRDRAETT